MATIANAMKGVILSSTSKTQGGSGSAALNDTDLVQLYDNAGNPNGKITKSALMDAVKASLPAILSDQTTTGVNFPSINSSGVLGKMTAANLASVLDGTYTQMSTGDINNISDGSYYCFSSVQNLPVAANVIVQQYSVNGGADKIQFCYRFKNGEQYSRHTYSGSWTNWYRNDNYETTSLSELASVLGATYNKELELNTDITSLGEGNYHTGSGSVVRSLVNAPSGANGECYIEVRNIYNKQYMYYRFWDSPRKMLFISQKRSSAATTLVWQQVYDTSLLTNSSLLSPLASALGGIYKGDGTIANIDDYNMKWGMYYVNGVTSGTCPLAQNLMYGGTLFVIPNQSYDRVVQIYINPSRGSFTRFNYAGEWQPWKVIYDENILTNSSILSPLASALGEYSSEKKMQDLNHVDLNTVSCGNGNYNVYTVRSSCTNRPAADGYMFIFKWLTAEYKTQVFLDPNNNDIYMRSTNSEGVWGDWISK